MGNRDLWGSVIGVGVGFRYLSVFLSQLSIHIGISKYHNIFSVWFFGNRDTEI